MNSPRAAVAVRSRRIDQHSAASQRDATGEKMFPLSESE